MKQHLSICVATLFGAALAAQAGDLLAHEPFEYGPTPNLLFADGGFGWSSSWGNIGALPTGVANTGLQYPNLLTSGNCAHTAPFPSSDFARYSRGLDPYQAPDGIVYISVLIRPGPGFGTMGGLAFGTFFNGMVMGALPTGVYGLSTPSGDMVDGSKIAVEEAQTTLVVARVQLSVGDEIVWSAYVNPTLGESEPAIADATLTIPGTMLPQAVFIYNDGGFSTDEIRVGLSWQSVLPSTTPVFADLNGDGVVGPADLAQLLATWGSCQNCAADLNHDGAVGPADLAQLLAHWG
jgi:hypothetical protein